MPQFVKFCIAFCIFIIALSYLNARFVTTDAQYLEQVKFKEAFHPTIKAPIIILGDSRGESSLNPVFFDDFPGGAYNFCFQGAQIRFVKDFYEKAIKPYYPKPRIIVYQVFPDMFMRDGRKFEQMSEYFPVSLFVKELIQSPERKMAFYNRFSLYKNRSNLWIKYHGNYDDSVHKFNFYKGWIPIYGFINITAHSELKMLEHEFYASIDDAKIEPQSEKMLDEMISNWIKDGIKVVFIQIPTLIIKKVNHKIALSKQESVLSSIAKKYNLIYLNYNSNLSSFNNQIYFYHDSKHLNLPGSIFFNMDLHKAFFQHRLNEFSKDKIRIGDYECEIGEFIQLHLK